MKRERVSGVSVFVAEDIFVPNDVLCLPRALGRKERLGVLRFEARVDVGQSSEAIRQRCLEVAREQLLLEWPGLTLWLFAAHTAWQQKSRILEHRRLWQSIERLGLAVPSGEKIYETSEEEDGYVRFFGVVGIPAEHLDRACEVIRVEPASFIVGSISGHPPAVADTPMRSWVQLISGEPSSFSILACDVC